MGCKNEEAGSAWTHLLKPMGAWDPISQRASANPVSVLVVFFAASERIGIHDSVACMTSLDMPPGSFLQTSSRGVKQGQRQLLDVFCSLGQPKNALDNPSCPPDKLTCTENPSVEKVTEIIMLHT